MSQQSELCVFRCVASAAHFFVGGKGMRKIGIALMVLLFWIWMVFPINAVYMMDRDELASLVHQHNYEWTTIVPVDCVNNGEMEGVCQGCADRQVQIVPATGHKYNEWEITIASECLIAGKHQRHCEICNGVEEEVIPAIGHMDFDRNGECDHCGETLGEKIPMVFVVVVSVGSTLLCCAAFLGAYWFIRKKKNR